MLTGYPPRRYKSSGENIVKIDFSAAKWLHQPKLFEITEQFVKITTEPNTDLWQRSYYGFRNDNAHALLLESEDNFTFSAQASFRYRGRFDQCGLIIYIDSDNWFKASIEYENEHISRLGSVVTNQGYSDWATTDIPTTTAMWYRLSRRGPDFLIESSRDGIDYKQMRIFHLLCLGETSPEMGRRDPPAPAEQPIRFGLYACSPLNSSFEAEFTNLQFDHCLWMAHGTE
jgi:regulation of enolase protein 1 (concanavalin A-like superfamily)